MGAGGGGVKDAEVVSPPTGVPASHVVTTRRTHTPGHHPPGSLVLLVHFQDEIASTGSEEVRAATRVGGPGA